MPDISNIPDISDISELKSSSNHNNGNSGNHSVKSEYAGIFSNPAVKSGFGKFRKSQNSGNSEDKNEIEIISVESGESIESFESAGSRRMPVLEKSEKSRKIEKSPGGLFEYLSNRKYYIFALTAVYILGVAIGAMLINNLERAEVINLCSIVDNYYTDLPAINMTARILGNIGVNILFIFGAYLCGVTVFAPLICSVFSLYKGLSIGFIIGVYTIGGGTGFHTAVGGLNFVLYLLIMVFFILVCAEAMSFSSFLFKSEDSFKSAMSFKNISVYSSRFIVFTLLIALATVVQTVAVPLVYSWLG
jgi:hypothetical protein